MNDPATRKDEVAPAADERATPPVRTLTERAHPLTPVVRTWIMLVGAGFWALQEFVKGTLSDMSEWGIGLWVFGGIALIQILWGALSWRFTRFVADDDEFRIEHTFVWHESKVISYSKIQSVDIQQPFAARLFGLAKIGVDVGGNRRTSIEYLKLSHAEAMRDHLLRMASPSRLVGHELGEGRDASPEPTAPTEAGEVVVAASPANLILASITSSSFLLTALGGVCAGFAIGWVIALPMLVPLGGIVASQVIGQWNYRLIRTGASLRTTRGLTTLSSQSVPRHRIQGIRITQPFLTRPFGLWRVQITVLGYSLGQEEVSNVLLPAGPWRDVELALNAVWPGFTFQELRWQPQPPRARWLTWFAWKTYGWSKGRLVFASRHGLITHAVDLVPYARMQGIDLRQGPLQRRLGLASVSANVSVGVVTATARHAEADEARRIVDDLVSAARDARASDLALHALLAGPQAPQTSAPPGCGAEVACPIVEP